MVVINSEWNYNPVRQNNNGKLDKYQIEFIIHVNAFDGHNFIYHINVFLENENISSIPPNLWHLPTTQRAAVNIIVSTRLYKDPDGFRKFFDNQESAPELFVMLKMQSMILASGTIYTNRKG